MSSQRLERGAIDFFESIMMKINSISKAKDGRQNDKVVSLAAWRRSATNLLIEATVYGAGWYHDAAIKQALRPVEH